MLSCYLSIVRIFGLHAMKETFRRCLKYGKRFLVEPMDYSISKKVVMNQLVCSATSVGANIGQLTGQKATRNLLQNSILLKKK